MKTHQKMCWSCDGHVHVYELQCPYCGADLSEEEKVEEIVDQELPEEQSAFEKVASPQRDSLLDELEHPPFESLIREAEETSLENEEQEWSAPPVQAETDLDNPLASLLLLLPGSLFFLFGLALFLFSDHGELTFKFNSKYWFVYLLGSWPLLYFGWRSLFPRETSTRKEDSEESNEEEQVEA